MEHNKFDGFSIETSDEDADAYLPTGDADSETEGDDEVVTMTKAEAEELKRQAKDGVQEAQKAMWKAKIYEDKFEFIKLVASDRKLAERFAKDWNEKRSVDQIAEDLKAEKKGVNADEKLTKGEVQEMLEAQEAEKELNGLMKEYKLNTKGNEKVKEAVLAEFEELMGQRKATPENVKTYFEKAIKLVGVNGEDDQDLTAVGLIGGKSGPTNGKQKTTVDRDVLQGKSPKDWYKKD